jgi:hypothetical protein
VGGNPSVADATNAAVKNISLPAGQFAFQFQERSALGNVARQFQGSPDLFSWTNTVPLQLSTVQTNGNNLIYQAAFSVQNFRQFFRIQYNVTN